MDNDELQVLERIRHDNPTAFKALLDCLRDVEYGEIRAVVQSRKIQTIYKTESFK